MFKGTNKMWKGIVSAALALTMLSTVAFAAETTNTITVTGDWAVYDGEANTVTVTGSISDAEADVTILAVRDAAAVDTATLATWTDEALKGKVVYIDQEASFEDGAFEFQFIPRSGIKGGKMTIFVGGENVSEVKSYTIDAAVKAPDVVPAEPWYEGEDLKLNIYKAGTTDVYGDEVAVDGWFDSINSFKVNGADVTGYTRSGNVITVPGVTAPATAIAITTTDGDYSEETWSGSVAQVKKPAGTITADAASITAGNAATFTVAESSVEGWLAVAAANVKVDGADAVASLAGTTLTVTLPELGDAVEENEYTVTVEVPNYEVATAKVTAVAPTKVAINKLTAPEVEYSATEFEEGDPAYDETSDKKQELFGKASVTLPADIDGVPVTWTIDGEDAEGTVPLTRAASDAETPDTDVVAVAKVEITGYKTMTMEFTLPVKQIGVAGIDVPITLNMVEAAGALATVTVDGVAATQDGLVFTAAALADGDHTVIAARPGYVTLTFTLTIAGGEVTSNNTTVAMVAGDLNDDGSVNGRDVGILGGAWDANSEAANWNAAADLNGDGSVNGRDVGILGGNWDYQRD